MRILVTGSRDWKDKSVIAQAIMDLKEEHSFVWEDVVIVHGDCPTGADAMANSFAWACDLMVEKHPADWGLFGRAAGPKRNQKMVDLGADIVLAFMNPGSKGTADCVKRAKRAGLTVRIYEP